MLFKIRYSWFHSGEGFSIMFHRQYKDIIVLVQRTGMNFSNKDTFPLTLRHCHTATSGKSEAAVKSVAASRVKLFFAPNH